MAKFGSSWFVRRDRIQMFLPLSDSLAFEIDRTGAGSLFAGNGPPTFKTSLGGVDAQGTPKSLDYNNAQVKALVLEGGSRQYFSFSSQINELLNNVTYRVGGRGTISFWVFNIDDTGTGRDGVGVDSNVVLGDEYAAGYTFGHDTQTSVIADYGAAEIASIKRNLDNHVLTVRDSMIASSDGFNYELKDWDGNDPSTKVRIPDGQWVLVSYVMDHTDSRHFKTTIHYRFYYNDSTGGNTVTLKRHYYKVATSMNQYVIDHADDQGAPLDPTVVDLAGRSNGTWNLGCSLVQDGDVYSPSLFYEGAIRNLTVHSVALTDDQLDRMFENGIDPYVAIGSPNTDPDSDQYDQRFWGKYGVLATGSHVRIEKTQAIQIQYRQSEPDKYYGTTAMGSGSTLHTLTQNVPKFSIAARDLSTMEVARDEVIEGASTNPAVADPTAADQVYNGWGAVNPGTGEDLLPTDTGGVYGRVWPFKAGSWRGSGISGDHQLSQKDSKAIWGSFINGKTRMMRLEPYSYNQTTGSGVNWNNPENLPPGKYIVEILNYEGNVESSLYPQYLPKYYYRDRLGRSWRRAGSTFNENNSNYATDEAGRQIYGTGSNVYVDEIFWDNSVQRYEKIKWSEVVVNNIGQVLTKAQLDADLLEADGTPAGTTAATKNKVYNNSSDYLQADFASKWAPVVWGTAIYDVDYGQSLDRNDVGGYVRLLLISSDYRCSAIYYKYRIPSGDPAVADSWSNWHFESFNFDQNNTASESSGLGGQVDHLSRERMARIFLPHVAIPELIIPLFHDTIDVSRVLPSTSALSGYGATSGKIADVGYGDYKGGKDEDPVDSDVIETPFNGMYLVMVYVKVFRNDDPDANVTVSSNGDVKTVYDGTRTGGGEEVTGWSTICVSFISYSNGYIYIRVNGDGFAKRTPTLQYVDVAFMSHPSIGSDGAISGIVMKQSGEIEEGEQGYDSRYKEMVLNTGGKDYIRIDGIGAKYTRYDYQSISDITDPYVRQTLLDQKLPQYDE